MMNFEQARTNMIQQQVRTWDVLDDKVLNVLETIRRDSFTPTTYSKVAYADVCIPLGNDQTMMKPVVEGRMLQALNLNKNDSVLEIGTGSGFITACLATLAQDVTSIDYFEEFIEQASSKLAQANISNCELAHADVMENYEPLKKFDAIVLTGSVQKIPEHIKKWLRANGKIFTIIGKQPIMEAQLFTYKGQDQWIIESLFETSVPPLIGAEPVRKFVF